MSHPHYVKLIYVPNIIGYIRVMLAVFAVLYSQIHNQSMCLLLFGINFFLDGLDGLAARLLNQATAFGAWLDVVADVISRGLLWCIVHPTIGYTIVCWEWIVFMSFHVKYGKKWKDVQQAPRYVSRIMEKNFKTPHGFFAIGSLFLLPMWCYAQSTGYLSAYSLPLTAQNTGFAILAFGRFLAFVVEAWYVGQYIRWLLAEEPN